MNPVAACLVPMLQRCAARCERHLLARCRRALAPDEVQEWARVLLQLQAWGSFFPHEHALHTTTCAVARYCQPLLQQAAATLSPAQLMPALQLLQVLAPSPLTALRMQLRRDLDRVLAVQDCHARQLATLAASLRHLSLLQRLAALPGSAPDQRLASARPATAIDTLRALLDWQIALARDAAAGSSAERARGSALLEPAWQQRLERIAGLCRRSDWTLEYHCRSGLAALLRQCRQLAQFCAATAVLRRLQSLQQLLLDAHLAGSAPGPAWQRQFASALAMALLPLAVADEGIAVSVSSASGPPAPVAAAALQAAVVAELQQWQSRLAAALLGEGGTDATPGQVMPLLYKPGWLLVAAGQVGAAQLLRSLWQLVAQCWRHGRALPAAVQPILAALASPTGRHWTQLPPASLEHWQDLVLRHWPGEQQELSVSLPDMALPGTALPETTRPETPLPDTAPRDTARREGAALRQLPLASVPALMSTSLRTLTAVTPAWFAAATAAPSALPMLREEPGVQRKEPAVSRKELAVLRKEPAVSRKELAVLRQELALLEQGAAALKAGQLETWCAVLRDCHARGTQIPADLLLQGHAQLIVLLDQAAAWQDAEADPVLLQALQEAVAAARPMLPDAAEAPAEPLSALELTLQDYLHNLAAVLEKPVRLELCCEGPAPPLQQCPQLAAALKPLLRFLLLDGASAMAARRAVRKSRVTQLSVKLLNLQDGLRLEAGDDCHGTAPDASALRRLQRALPVDAGPLGWESAGAAGRRFTLLLPAAKALA